MAKMNRKAAAAKTAKKIAKPDFKLAFQEEVARLARKAERDQMKVLKEQLSALKKVVALQNARIKALENGKPAPVVGKGIIAVAAADAASGKKIRLNAARIIAVREKRGLNQVQFAKILGVSNFSVNHWELGKSAPRMAAKQAIAALRGMGKKEFAALCAEKGVTPGKWNRKGKKAAKAVKAVKAVKAAPAPAPATPAK